MALPFFLPGKYLNPPPPPPPPNSYPSNACAPVHQNRLLQPFPDYGQVSVFLLSTTISIIYLYLLLKAERICQANLCFED